MPTLLSKLDINMKKPAWVASGAVALALMAFTGSAQALTINMISSAEQHESLTPPLSPTTPAGGAPANLIQSDTAAAPPGGGASAFVDLEANFAAFGVGAPIGGAAEARSNVNQLGFSAVNVEGIFAGPFQGTNLARSQTIFSQTETNNTGSAQDYEMSVLLKGGRIALANFAGNPSNQTDPFFDPQSDAMGARINYTVLVNGVPIFAAEAKMYGFQFGSNAHTFDKSGSMDGTAPDGSAVSSDLGGVFFVDDPNFANIIGYDLGDIIGTLDIGTFADGDTFVVDAIMTAEVVALPFELGGIARMADPLNLQTASQTGPLAITPGTPPTTPPTQVPAPGALAIFLIGLGGLAMSRRRR